MHESLASWRSTTDSNIRKSNGSTLVRYNRNYVYPVGAPLSRWKAVMAARMESGNFTGVVTNEAEVAAGRSGGWTSVSPIQKQDLRDGRQDFVVAIVCAPDSDDVARPNPSGV